MSNENEQHLDGQVKWFNDQKGYGFITRADFPDIFVHYSAIQMDGFRTLKEGDSVTFELLESPKGLQAINVAASATESATT